MTDAIDGDLFRIERLLSKLWQMRVSVARRGDAAYFFLNNSWTLRLDEDDVDVLRRTFGSDHAFLEQLDEMLDDRMKLAEVRQEYRQK